MPDKHLPERDHRTICVGLETGTAWPWVRQATVRIPSFLGARQPEQLLCTVNAVVGQVQRAVQRGLPADRRKERVGPFFFDDRRGRFQTPGMEHQDQHVEGAPAEPGGQR